jgi:exopolysaccharide production protein ExoQ
MMQLAGTIVCIAGIAWLFYLDRDRGERTSAALWLATAWMTINCSRPVSMWIFPGASGSLMQRYTEGSPLDAAVFGLLIAGGVIALNYRSLQVKEYIQSNAPILVLFAYCALSVAWADAPFIAFKRWGKSLGDLVMIMIVLTDQNPRFAIKRVFTRSAFVLLPLSVLFITCFPSLGSAFDAQEMRTMYFGVTTFKNLLGMIAMVFGLASLCLLMEAYEDREMPHRTKHLAAHLILIAIAVWLITTADSMTALGCFALAGTVMMAVSLREIRSKTARVYAVVCGALIVPVFAVFLDSMGILLHVLGRNTTLTGRTAIWKAVLAMHTNPLTGAGFESFWLGNRLERVWNMSVYGIQEAHNGYLEFYLNLGWIGVALLAWMIVIAFRNSIAALRSGAPEGRLRVAFLVMSLTYSLTEAGFRMLTPVWFAFLLSMTAMTTFTASNGCEMDTAMSRAETAKRKRIKVL